MSETLEYRCDCDDSCTVCDLGNHHWCHTGDCTLGSPAAVKQFAQQAKKVLQPAA